MEELNRKKATKDTGVMLTAQVECCLCPGTGGSTFLVTSYLHSNSERQSQFLLYRLGNEFNGQAQTATKLHTFKLSSYIVGTWSEQMIRGDSVWGEVPFLL